MQIPRSTESFDKVHNMLMSSLAAKAVLAAVELKIFDVMTDAPRSVEDVSDELGLVAERLEPVLDILEAEGVVRVEEGGYVNTQLAQDFLVTSSPLYQGMGVKLNMGFAMAVEDSIADFLGGKDINLDDPDTMWEADDVMEGTAQHALGTGVSPVVEFVSALPGFSDFRTIGDIGGNHGLYSLGIMSRNEALRGTVYDLPQVAEQARARFTKLGKGDQLSAVGFNLRTDSLPTDSHDLIIASHILYGFTDDLAAIIKRIADGLQPGGWLVSHHNADRHMGEDRTAAASLELLTRLCGYPSHFIERPVLSEAFERAGLTDVRFQPASSSGFGLIAAARKAG